MKFIKYLFLLFVLAVSELASAKSIPEGVPSSVTGIVVGVSDGDCIHLQTADGEVIKVRLYGIDAPESEWEGKWPAQPYSNQAKQHLENLVLGKSVTANLTGKKSFDRLVGEVFLHNLSTSEMMVASGLGWWNNKYAPRSLNLRDLELEAVRNQKGLWSEPNPTPPWVHRNKHR